jgi:hypothetical protein
MAGELTRLAFLDFRAGPPPSNGTEVLLWRDSRQSSWFPEQLLCIKSLVDVDRTKAATGCGIIAATIPVMAVMLIIHGRLVIPFMACASIRLTRHACGSQTLGSPRLRSTLLDPILGLSDPC